MADYQNETDIYNTPLAYNKQLKYIKEHTGFSEEEKELIFDFLNTSVFQGAGIVQRIKYVYGLRNFYDFYQAPLKNCKPENLKAWLAFLHGKYKIKTVGMRWYSLKKFYEHIGMGNLYDNIKVKFKKRSESKLPEELLSKDEIANMMQHVYNPRDKAIIGTLYETGCRIGEFLSRKVKHLDFDRYGGILMVDGKTGMRRVRLVESVPLLATWLDHHPMRDKPDAPLWINLQRLTERVNYCAIALMLRKAAKRAEIRKKIHPHLFRHSRATELAKHLTEQQLKAYLGWTNSSDMAAIYVHLSGKDVDNAILGMYKEMQQPEQQKPELKHCPRCTSQNHFSARYCGRCGGLLVVSGED